MSLRDKIETAPKWKVVLVYLGLLALNIIIFFLIAKGTFEKKFEMFLQILGFYTFVFGLVTQTDLLKGLNLADEMSSSNLVKFLQGNLSFISLLLSSLGVMAHGSAENIENRKSGFLDFPLLMFVFIPISLVYVVFHLIVIMPITYFPYIIASTPLQCIKASSGIDRKYHGGEKYLFCWDNVPGKENSRLLRYLKDDLDFGLVENAQIIKTDDNRTIHIFTAGSMVGERAATFRFPGSIEIMLENKKKAILKASGVEIRDDRTGKIGLLLPLKEENGNLNVYGNEMISIRNIVLSNEVSLRNFIIAIPVSLYSLISSIVSIF